MAQDPVVIEVPIAAPADAAWAALREPPLIAQWFGWDSPGLAEEIQYIFVDHAEALEAERTLRFKGMPDSLRVVPVGDGCLVQLTRAGAAGDESDWDGANEDMTEGWMAFLSQLRFALERHPGQTRRTIYLSGKPAEGANTSLPRARLGLVALANIDEGGPYSLHVGIGESLTGQVWSRSRRQLALTAEGYGDGLVLVTDRTPELQPPVGGGSVIVTTYGLDDAAFTELKGRWESWWRDHFPEGMKVTTGQA